MANYGYGNENYSTTAYGAQGGIDGGGFLGGTQSGSQSNPEGNVWKRYFEALNDQANNRSVSFATMELVSDANNAIISQQPHPDSEFKVDGVEVTQITFIGQIQAISSQATNTTYKVDDGTGLIEVKQWIDSDADPENSSPLPKENDYIRIWGRLRSFNSRRHVGAHMIRVITDFNEITYHLLEATTVHLYFSRGPPPSTDGVKNENSSGIFVENLQSGTNTNGTGIPNGLRKLPSNISVTARKVYNLLSCEAQSNEGLHISLIAQKLNMQVNDAFKAGDELLGAGAIYTTVDDETWAIL